MIRKLSITGFQSHKRTEFEFSDRLNVITGPTDVGKSAVTRALGWLTFNRPSGDSFVNGSESRVTVTTTRGTATRERKPVNMYVVNGIEFKSFGSSVPEELNQVLNLNEVNFQNQIADQYFLLTSSPGLITKRLSELLGYQVVDVAISIGKSKLSSLQQALTTMTTERQRLEGELRKLDRLDEIKWLIERFEETELELTNSTALITPLMDLSNQLAATELAIESANRVLAAFEKATRDIDSYIEIQSQHESLVDLLSSVADDRLISRCKRLLNDIDEPGFEELPELLINLSTLDSVCIEAESVNQDITACSRSLKLVSDSLAETLDLYLSELRKLNECPLCGSKISSEVVERISRDYVG